MSFDWLYQPVEFLDEQLAHGLDGVGIVVVLVLAALLGLRHAMDPDHVIAVAGVVSDKEAKPRDAARIGAWWGAGHALILLAVGIPLTASESVMPSWLEQTAEKLIGAVIVLLAVRMLYRWVRRHRHHEKPAWATFATYTGENVAQIRGAEAARPRTAVQAAGIGMVHGLGGTGAVTLFFLGALPNKTDAMLALLVFAPMSVVSMAAITWVGARVAAGGGRRFTTIATPLFAVWSLAFGAWFAGVI